MTMPRRTVSLALALTLGFSLAAPATASVAKTGAAAPAKNDVLVTATKNVVVEKTTNARGKNVGKVAKKGTVVTATNKPKKGKAANGKKAYYVPVKVKIGKKSVKGYIAVSNLTDVFDTAKAPKVSGTAQVGKTLKATHQFSEKGQNLTLSYQWLRNGSAIRGAKSVSYKIAAADQGKKISVKVTAKASGIAAVAKTSATTGAIKAAPAPAQPATPAMDPNLT